MQASPQPFKQYLPLVFRPAVVILLVSWNDNPQKDLYLLNAKRETFPTSMLYKMEVVRMSDEILRNEAGFQEGVSVHFFLESWLA